MNQYRFRFLASLDDLRNHADRWNSLWEQSETCQPTVTAELIDLWCQSFSSEDAFQAVVVEEDGRFVGGLPLIRHGRLAVTQSYELPTNCWASAGDLLLDLNYDQTAVCRTLVHALGQLNSPFVVFEGINTESQHWTTFIRVLDEQRREYRIAPTYPVGVTHILHDWSRFEASWSNNHRRGVKRGLRRLHAAGDITTQRVTSDSSDLESILHACFEIEDRGWKGDVGGSILQTPRMPEYFLEEAQRVGHKGMLDLWLLKLNGQVIAFNYGHHAKGTSIAHKISYDPDYANLAPGRLLRYYQLEAMHADPEARLFDTFGKMSKANAAWSTAQYTLGKLIVATQPGISSQMLKAFKVTQPWLKRFKGSREESFPEPAIQCDLSYSDATQSSPSFVGSP